MVSEIIAFAAAALLMGLAVERNRRHLPILSLFVRLLFWISRWWYAIAVAADHALMSYRYAVATIPRHLYPKNEDAIEPTADVGSREGHEQP